MNTVLETDITILPYSTSSDYTTHSPITQVPIYDSRKK